MPTDVKERTLLRGASASGQLDIVQWLLSRSADPQLRDEKGWTTLHSVAVLGDVEIARLLVEHGVKIVEENDEGMTAFQVASKRTGSPISQSCCRTLAPNLNNVTYRSISYFRLHEILWRVGKLILKYYKECVHYSVSVYIRARASAQ